MRGKGKAGSCRHRFASLRAASIQLSAAATAVAAAVPSLLPCSLAASSLSLLSSSLLYLLIDVTIVNVCCCSWWMVNGASAQLTAIELPTTILPLLSYLIYLFA